MNRYHRNKFSAFVKLYLPIFVFILGWWSFAFKKPPSKLIETSQPRTALFSSSLSQLSEIKRPLLLKALGGDIELMSQYIIDWDLDAQMIQSEGNNDVKRLPFSILKRSREINQQIKSAHTTSSNEPSYIIDAAGRTIHINNTYQRFLPQTYSAASMLLALVPAEQIVALPDRLRNQTTLFPEQLTKQIPLDIERYNGEKLFLKQPDIAFIANFSNPATVEALSNQNILLYTMRNPNTIDDITAEICNIGHIINCSLRAELLSIFMNAAMLALDNRLCMRTDDFKLLFLNYHLNFSIPTSKMLTGQLLKRLSKWDISQNYISEANRADDWMLPVSKESILNLDPDYLVVSTDNKTLLEKEILNDPALQQLKAVKHGRIYFLDEAIQHSPTQYIIMAYYDLVTPLIDKNFELSKAANKGLEPLVTTENN